MANGVFVAIKETVPERVRAQDGSGQALRSVIRVQCSRLARQRGRVSSAVTVSLQSRWDTGWGCTALENPLVHHFLVLCSG